MSILGTHRKPKKAADFKSSTIHFEFTFDNVK